MTSSVYIPKRLYEQLKCIYSERMTVVCAPLGHGKSTMLREFVRRSRRDGISCRFVTDSSVTSECFERICLLVLGEKLPMPITEEESARLVGRFVQTRLEKPLVLVLDCGAAEPLFGNAYCLRLLRMCEGLHLVFVCEEVSYHREKLARAVGAVYFTEKDLAFTEEETAEYFSRCGIQGADARLVCRKTEGCALSVRLCALHLSEGRRPPSYEMSRLLASVLTKRTDRTVSLALLCAVFGGMDESVCAVMREEPLVMEHFGAQLLQPSVLQEGLAAANSLIPCVEVNARRGEYKVHPMIRSVVTRYVEEQSPEVSRAMYRCAARYSDKHKRRYMAFLCYLMAREYVKAAAVEQRAPVPLEALMASKEVLFRFVLECPLDCKPIVPKLVRALAVLMLTAYKERVKFRFDEVIAYVSAAPDYTAKERNNILAYTHALRTYQDFYLVDRMGAHIKRAYDYFSGTAKLRPPLYSWTLYVPSIFALVHRYSVPLSTEREQFVRYQKMYTEMIGHGALVDRLYIAEEAYYCGSFVLGRERASQLLEECTDERDAPAKMIALTIYARCCLMLGEFDGYKRSESEIAALMRRFSATEIDDMGALCLALLGVLKSGDAYIGNIALLNDSKLLKNRYTAPFSFYVRTAYMLKSKDYSRLLARKDYFLEAAEDVGSWTMALKIKMCAAAAQLLTGAEALAAETMLDVMRTLDNSEVIMPAVEICFSEPRLFEFARSVLPQEYAEFIGRVQRMTRSLRRTVEVFRTREMTECSAASRQEKTQLRLEERCAAAREHLSGVRLTEKALRYAVLAAMGRSNADIARLCGASEDSVKSSLKRTFERLGLRSRAQLRYALGLNSPQVSG